LCSIERRNRIDTMGADGTDIDAVKARACEAWIPSRGVGSRSAEEAGRRIAWVIISKWRIQRRPLSLVPVILAPAQELAELLLDSPENAAAILFLPFALIHSATVAIHRASFRSKCQSTTLRRASP
jgi:hypothetical protein